MAKASITYYEAVYKVVAHIPPGRVATYGDVATWLGAPRAARAVGYALAADACGHLPWHRIINHRGEISVGGAPWRPDVQRQRLEAEGLVFSPQGAVCLRTHRFHPTQATTRRWLALGARTRAGRPATPPKGIRA